MLQDINQDLFSGIAKGKHVDVDTPHLSVAEKIVFGQPPVVVIDGEPVGQLVGFLLVPADGRQAFRVMKDDNLGIVFGQD